MLPLLHSFERSVQNDSNKEFVDMADHAVELLEELLPIVDKHTA